MFKLKYKASNSTNLDLILNKLTSKLFDLIFDEDSISYEASDFGQLIIFTIKNINECNDLADYFNNNTILFGIIDQFIAVFEAKKQPLDSLFEKILFRTGLSNKLSLQSYNSIFKSLVFQSNNLFNRDLILQMYLNDRTNYIYSQYHQEIFIAPETVNGSINQWLRQIDYTLKLLNRYFNLAGMAYQTTFFY